MFIKKFFDSKFLERKTLENHPIILIDLPLLHKNFLILFASIMVGNKSPNVYKKYALKKF